MPGKGPSLEREGEEGPERKEPKATSWLFPLLLLSSGVFQGSDYKMEKGIHGQFQ